MSTALQFQVAAHVRLPFLPPCSCYIAEHTGTFSMPGFSFRKEAMPMKYGITVSIMQTGYIEVEADCEEEAKAKAAEAVSEDRILYHETEVKECKIEGYF